MYSAGQNMFICSKQRNSDKMKLQNALDNICDMYEYKSEKDKTKTKTVFYR